MLVRGADPNCRSRPGTTPHVSTSHMKPKRTDLRPSLLPSAAMLLQAPHRLLFFIGALNVLAAMSWWLWWLAALRWQWWSVPNPPAPMPATWGHGLVMSYLVFTPFIFGFLLTVFPRWTGQPPLSRRHYVPVGTGLLAGQLLTVLGLCGSAPALQAGLILAAAGWLYGMCSLTGVLRRAASRDWHALSCLLALSTGLTGLLLFIAWWQLPTRTALASAALGLGIPGFLLPIFLTVAHRMLPFFAGNVVPGYRGWKPLWVLAALWLLLLMHLALELAALQHWRWLPDLGLVILSCLWLWRIWPVADPSPAPPLPGLLIVLFIALCWLPLAFLLYTTQSLAALAGKSLLGRAPAHALAIGLFGSLLVAMVTRVTQGHSGRPLSMSATAWFAFASVQLTAMTRIAAELVDDGWAWQAVAALGWILAFLPWVLRNTRIYLRPRSDGKPG